MDGIEEVSVTLEEEGDFIFYKIICKSFHLTSFAVLLDVHGITEVGDQERTTVTFFEWWSDWSVGTVLSGPLFLRILKRHSDSNWTAFF